MKKLLLILFCLPLLIMAQAPQGFTYQGVATDNNGFELQNQTISIQASILSSSATGTTVWQETHTTTTDTFGLFNVTIGEGISTNSGSNATFSEIDWGAASHYMKVEIDVNGGSNFVHVGTSQMMSVPYALYAENINMDSVSDYLTNDSSFMANVGGGSGSGNNKITTTSLVQFDNNYNILSLPKYHTFELLETDANSNLYMLGTYNAAASSACNQTLGGDTLACDGTMDNADATAFYLYKSDSNGVIQAVYSETVLYNNDRYNLQNLTVDDAGNIIVLSVNDYQQTDLVLYKFDSQLNLIFKNTIGTDFANTVYNYKNTYALATDDNNDIYISGSFAGTHTIGSSTISPTLNSYDGFLAKISSTGVSQWATIATNDGHISGNSTKTYLTIDNNIISCFFNYQLKCTKFDQSGNFITSFQNNDWANIYSFGSSNGNKYILSMFGGWNLFQGMSYNPTLFYNEYVLIKIDQNDSVQYIKGIGTDGTLHPTNDITNIVELSSGNILIGLHPSNDGLIMNNSLHQFTSSQPFALEYDQDGNYVDHHTLNLSNSLAGNITEKAFKLLKSDSHTFMRADGLGGIIINNGQPVLLNSGDINLIRLEN
jgi:hypothetical protein